MMERLTGNKQKNVSDKEILERLTQYEDTGLSPEEIQRTIEEYTALVYEREKTIDKFYSYRDAEEEGRLFILPCKVGETIYPIFHCDTPCDGMPEDTEWAYFAYKADVKFLIDNINNFGKTVFLTEEEAMTRVKELGKSKE